MAILASLLLGILIRADLPDARYRAFAEEPQFAAAVAVVTSGRVSASGVLIGDRWVLTAAHVALGGRMSPLSVRIAGEDIPVRRVHVAPGFEDPSLVGLARSEHDVGILELDGATSVQPAHIAWRTPSVGTLATIVGFGVGGHAGTDGTGTKRAACNVVDQVGGRFGQREYASHVILLDFDDGSNGSVNALGSATPCDLEGLALGGDSGGGLFVQEGAQWRLSAVFSLSVVDALAVARSDFRGAMNLFVGLDPHRGWIERTTSTEPPGSIRGDTLLIDNGASGTLRIPLPGSGTRDRVLHSLRRLASERRSHTYALIGTSRPSQEWSRRYSYCGGGRERSLQWLDISDDSIVAQQEVVFDSCRANIVGRISGWFDGRLVVEADVLDRPSGIEAGASLAWRSLSWTYDSRRPAQGVVEAQTP